MTTLPRFRFALLAVATTALLAACGHQENAGAPVTARTVAARTLTLTAADQVSRTDLPGVVVAAQQVQVASRLMGYIRELKVHEGETVKPGQLLFVVDPTDVQGQVAQARAGLAQAQANFANAQSDYERFGKLYREEAIPRQQWDQVKLRYDVAREQLAAARAGYGTAGAQLRYSSVTAPIAGIVVQKLADAGDLAAPGRPVVVIESPGTLQVQTQVSDAVYAYVKVGEPVTIIAQGRTLTGTVARAVSAADPLSHTHLVKIDLPADSGLDSGSFVRVGFTMGSAPALMIPASAVVERAGMTGVFVINRDGTAPFRLVRLGAASGSEVAVQAGLVGGETIAVSDTAALQNGVKVSGGARG